jgi:TrmH family RNA methyltransferase
MKTITSRQNALFQRVRRAIDEHAGEIVIEGPKAVADATAAGWKPIAVIERDKTFDARLFDSLAETKTSQGVIGLFERPAPTDVFADRDRVVVALDAVQDPGNVGTIVRLAAAFDAGGVVLLPGCADAYSPKAIRASVGAILNVPIVNMLTNELLARGWPLFAADAGGKSIDPPSRGAVLLFGNEGSGVSAELRARATPIAIPMSSRVESLNVAASAAILLARSYALR